VQVTVAGLGDGAYHWQARAVDGSANAGAFASFGGNSEADPDFRVDATNAAPSAPFAVGQYDPAGVVGLALGGSPFGRTVVVKAAAVDEDFGQVAIQIELRAVGVAFTDTPTHAGTFGPTGIQHSVTIDDLAGGSYHWQVRALDNSGQTSAWVAYGGNSESEADFVITATTAVPPNAPLSLQQRVANDLAPIATGDTIAQAAVRMKALVVHPRTEIVKLQVEIVPLAASYTGTPTRESGFVASGTVAEVIVFGMPNDSYRWQARTVDSKGTPSAWVPFGGNAESDADVIVAVPVNTAPDAPPFVLQHQVNGTTMLPTGAATTQSAITFDALGTDADSDPVRLEVELKPVGVAFDGQLSGSTGFFPSGTYLYVRVGGIADGRYHWRARVTDANGASSTWAAYGGNAETDADFVVNGALNAAPGLASALEQLRDGSTGMGVGELAGAGDVTFRSDADDADGTDVVRLDLEVRPAGEALAGVGTHGGEFVPQGFVAEALVGRFVVGTGYRWQARVVDQNGASGGWVEFGGNGSGADFVASLSIAGGGSRKTCGSIGIDLLVPLGVLALLRRRKRR
jgi:NADH:ubiquinone oxidoreductase subunit